MPVNYSASQAGHYSDNALAIDATGAYYLKSGSYNNVFFAVAYIAVSNAGNENITTVTFSDGSAFTVSPYTNSLIAVEGRESCTVTNNGDAAIKITLMDSGHARAYGSQYTQPPWQGAASLNSVLLHFAETPVKNYGYDKQATLAPFPTESISTTGGKFAASGYIAGTGLSTDGFGISTSEVISGLSANVYTIDFWAYPTAPPTASYSYFLASTDNAAPATPAAMLIYSGGVQWRVGSSAFANSPFPTIGAWSHIALVHPPGGTDAALYINGVSVGVASVGTLSTNLLYLQTKTTTTALIQPFSGRISEFRYTNRAIWLSNFTPPVAPYS